MNQIKANSADLILAEFSSAGALIEAAAKLRDSDITDFDCHSPFPIHGMDAAMGLKRSPLGFIVGASGFFGLVGAMILMWWTSSVDYPLVISGKPYFSYQAFVPVAFALTVLFCAFGAFFGMLALNRLPRLFNPLFYSNRFSRVTDGGFFVSVETDESERVISFLESIGGSNVEVVAQNEE